MGLRTIAYSDQEATVVAPGQLERLGDTESFAAFVVGMFPPGTDVGLTGAFGGGALCVARHAGREYRGRGDTPAGAAIDALRQLAHGAPQLLPGVRAPIGEGVQLPLPLTD